MITNFIDAWATNLCRGLNGVLGFYPSTCLNNAGRPMLFLVAVALALLLAAVAGWRKLRSRA